MSLSLSEFRAPAASNLSERERHEFVPSASSLDRPRVFAFAAWHSLAWLVFANAVGVLLALLLLVPRLNDLLGEWTYGRWMPVHINLQLYGWCSLPLVAFLFKVYGADREPAAKWVRPILWGWSSALAFGAFSWVTGHSSGKLFLDWTGYSRILFPLALAALWLLLASSFACEWKGRTKSTVYSRATKLISLALLLAVPALIYIAASPDLYPPINPDSGGPTGASQLESVLVIVAILLLLPFGLTRRNPKQLPDRKIPRAWQVNAAWIVFAAECLLCLGLGRADVSHHRPTQYISLGSLLVWLPLAPAYYGAFEWHSNTLRWRIALLCWWSILIPSGWCLFLPGVLDHFKFTDGLVGHSLLAMAGFASSLLIFVMVQLLGEDGWIFNTVWSFYLWQCSVLAYVLLMFFSGWREGFAPAFASVPSPARNAIYVLRLLLGVLMLVASGDWLIDSSSLLRESASGRIVHPQGQAS
jgi:cytochrome c oxidase cbb3-type subunit 1